MSVLVAVLTALQAASPTARNAPPSYPFEVGERLEYSAKLSILRVGTAAIEVASLDTVRGNPAFHFRYSLNASVPFFKIASTLESWTSVSQFHALRFRQDSKENSKQYLRSFEILSDSGYYRQVLPSPAPSAPTPSEPLDDASILYFVRTTPLTVGRKYNLERYFRADRNPIVIKVLKRETLELPDGTKVPCLVLNPVVGERGLFGPRTDARLWLTDDARRIPVQIESRQPFGPITLKLEKIGRTG